MPEEQDFLRAQALANLDAIFFTDPDNLGLVKDELFERELNDNTPVYCRPRRFSMLQQAFLKHKISIMVRWGMMEECTGEYASPLVLVPYHDRIQKFQDRIGETTHV